MGWFRRRWLRRPVMDVEPVVRDEDLGEASDPDGVLVMPLVCRHPHEGEGNAGRHWDGPTVAVPNLPSDRLLTLGGQRRARAAARRRWPLSAPYADGGADWRNWWESR
jgi:hypothetical protein